MILSAIVAVSDNNVIGREGSIPWHIPGEQARLKDITMGHPLIMGRKTHESIGRTLPGRLNVVISGNQDYRVAEGSVLARSLEEALDLPEVKAADEAFIFGGEAIYKQAMPSLQRIYLTRVHIDVKGDSFFDYDAAEWKTVSTEAHPKNKDNPCGYDYLLLERL